MFKAMCGIFAIFGPYDRTEAISCAETIQHRGPDNTVYYPVSHGFLGFHRLSIMDTSSAGNQPFSGSTWTFMCNGEIYNAEELKTRYGIQSTSSQSDCEILFQLLEQGKLDFHQLVREIYGVYSIVAVQKIITNTTDSCGVFQQQTATRVYIARDPVGVRPLFWVQTDANLVIASEARGLVKYGSLIRVFQPDSAVEITIDSCGSISPNHVVIKTPKLCAPFPSDAPSICNKDLAVQLVKNVVERVVRIRMHSDRPMACFLSGGVDSSTVAALVAKFSPVPIHTFSIGLEGSTDLAFARIVANHIGSIHHEVIQSEADFTAAVPEVIRSIQSYDVTTVRASTPMFLLSKYISENTDFKVVFSGEGPDEVCGSYMYFHASPGPDDSAQECRRLVSDMHYFDVLRSDRCTARWGLEVRVPLLATDFIQTYWSIDPQLRVPQPCVELMANSDPQLRVPQPCVELMANSDPLNSTMKQPLRIEKWIFRKAFEDLLPSQITWRPKEAFSDGVSAKERSWSTILQSHVDTQISIDELNVASSTFPHHTPKTKEALWMRKIYSEYYPHMEHLIPYQWLPKWVGKIDDPSARVLSMYRS